MTDKDRFITFERCVMKPSRVEQIMQEIIDNKDTKTAIEKLGKLSADEVIFLNNVELCNVVDLELKKEEMENE